MANLDGLALLLKVCDECVLIIVGALKSNNLSFTAVRAVAVEGVRPRAIPHFKNLRNKW